MYNTGRVVIKLEIILSYLPPLKVTKLYRKANISFKVLKVFI